MSPAEVRDKLRDFIRTELLQDPGYPLKDDQPLISSGLIDSFSLAQVGVFVEMTFDVYIPDTDLTVDAMDTIDKMADRIVKG
jgi:acyl carrier protein